MKKIIFLMLSGLLIENASARGITCIQTQSDRRVISECRGHQLPQMQPFGFYATAVIQNFANVICISESGERTVTPAFSKPRQISSGVWKSEAEALNECKDLLSGL